ncbi:hypothetical protein CPB84DRAFT_236790 [Gymnopilus junonius]|uniref:Uncharacterized protein n=1 Tax=Gymnopilus junonius TaxID=109634 RepID=A0A9P5NFD4_GYMJU|nr:hypothetical protein CPB84DRAFT_236790 [Gymnopilus junonius]
MSAAATFVPPISAMHGHPSFFSQPHPPSFSHANPPLPHSRHAFPPQFHTPPQGPPALQPQHVPSSSSLPFTGWPGPSPMPPLLAPQPQPAVAPALLYHNPHPSQQHRRCHLPNSHLSLFPRHPILHYSRRRLYHHRHRCLLLRSLFPSTLWTTTTVIGTRTSGTQYHRDE